MVCSCGGNTFDSEEELMTFLLEETNGYKHSKTVNGVDFSLMYRPTDLLVKQELGDKEVTKEEVRKLRDKYKNNIYFNLSMSKNNQELLSTAPRDRNEFGAMVNQLAFGMGEKVHLFTQSKDTLELADFVYPRLYGMGRATTIMFVYPRTKEQLNSKDILNFTIEDLGLYTGEVRFKVGVDRLIDEPKLKF
ncbi:hypothetical protein KCG49_07750 [Winogradskyella sp. WHY3]|uniref:Uncharacterized protein n=2 Tax=Winogradskyella luteola TaxID=2828330 RepID=A0A9X1JQN3_9FLAO|nr:hypothetical protein [Winogradskyella luteola]